jgi:hypothetical protein
VGNLVPAGNGRQVTTRRLERDHGMSLRYLDQQRELAEEAIASIGHVTGHATASFMRVQMVRREAECIAPDGAEIYAMICMAGGIEMSNAVSRFARKVQ